MSTTSSSERIREHILDLIWSLWAELGVSSWTRRHQEWAIDPEPLIVFTAHISDADRRLRDEALDWCIRYGTFVSTTRLRNLVKDAPPEQQTAFATFAATVNAHSDHRWPSSARPINYKPTGRSSLASFTAAALIALRLRALFGVAARADILRVIISEPDRAFTASDLINDVNYTKRNIDNALDPLAMAGLLEVRLLRNQHLYRLAERATLLEFIGQRPRMYPRWRPIFFCLSSILDLACHAPEITQRPAIVEANRIYRQVLPLLEEARLMTPAIEIAGADAWTTLYGWAEELTRRLALGDDAAFQ